MKPRIEACLAEDGTRAPGWIVLYGRSGELWSWHDTWTGALGWALRLASVFA